MEWHEQVFFTAYVACFHFQLWIMFPPLAFISTFVPVPKNKIFVGPTSFVLNSPCSHSCLSFITRVTLEISLRSTSSSLSWPSYVNLMVATRSMLVVA